jgi:hypothetical protein
LAISLGRPARKKSYAEAKAAERGRIQARVEAERKKPLDVSLREHIGKVIDNTNITDIVEVIAAVGLTPVIYNVILSEQKLFDQVKLIIGMPIALASGNIPAYVTDVIGLVFGALSWLGVPYKEKPIKPGETPAVTPKVPAEVNYMTWLVSFSIAYIIIKNAGQLIGLLDKGLEKVVPLLLGVVL